MKKFSMTITMARERTASMQRYLGSIRDGFRITESSFRHVLRLLMSSSSSLLLLLGVDVSVYPLAARDSLSSEATCFIDVRGELLRVKRPQNVIVPMAQNLLKNAGAWLRTRDRRKDAVMHRCMVPLDGLIVSASRIPSGRTKTMSRNNRNPKDSHSYSSAISWVAMLTVMRQTQDRRSRVDLMFFVNLFGRLVLSCISLLLSDFVRVRCGDHLFSLRLRVSNRVFVISNCVKIKYRLV